MEKRKVIHLEEANTLSNFLTKEERENIVSLKITGYIGQKDFEDVLDEMCDACGEYDEYDNFIPDYELTPALRHLDLGEATYADGEGMPYFGFHAQLETFILPKGLTTIAYEETGFSESDMLQKVVLPDGLKKVFGFNSCPNLSGIVLPESVEKIESFAFAGCKAISSLRIPSMVKEIDGSCFADCNISSFEVDKNNPYYSAIDGVIFSKDLSTLVAFPSAYSNKHYVVPLGTKIIGYAAFMDSHIESVELPDGLMRIEADAFQGSDIRRLDMPDSIVSVGELAFRFCMNLENIRLSNKLSSLPHQLFSGCPKLRDLNVPSSVKTIYYSAIAWCDGLENLYLQDGLEEIVDEGPMLGVKGKLKTVNFPATIKKVPGGVFNYSSLIKEFKLDPANTSFKVIDGVLCSKDGKTLYSVPYYNRTSYQVPEGIEVIAERVFAFLPMIETINLSSTLKIIKSRAFQGCKSLRSLVIPASVVQVDVDALWADSLKTIVMESSLPPEMTGNVKDDDWRYKDTTLLVPPDAVAAYKVAPGWKCFIIKQMKD